MTGIDRVGLSSPAAAGTRAARSAGHSVGFPPPDAGEAAAVPGGLVGAGPVALESLLALQQVDQTGERDRAARRHGQALLAALARLQRGLLEAADPASVITELSGLLADTPQAADPLLAEALDHVVLRAHIEIVRRGG